MIIAFQMIFIYLTIYRHLEFQGLIDSTNNIADSKVLIVHGTHDNIVNPVDANKIREYYEKFHVNPDNVRCIMSFHFLSDCF